MTKAVYAFSGDPITLGHIDVVKRAANIFDELTVAIGVNPDKKYTFSLKERTDMARMALGSLQNVKVVSFTGLLVDYAYENDIQLIIKGLRDEKDFNYELVLHQAGRTQQKGIETFFIPADPELMYVSSSVVKELQKEHGEVHKYVPLNVKQKLEQVISEQYIIGVTGEIGVGKSYIANKLVENFRKSDIEAHSIELDEINRKILEELDEPVYIKAREDIAKEFGSEVLNDNRFIKRKVLGDIVFGDQEKLEKLNNILHPLVVTRLRRELQNKKGIIILTAALFAEADMNYLFNNNVVLVDCSKETQKRRLEERGLDSAQIIRRIESQFNFDKKKQVLEDNIVKEGYGYIWKLINDDIGNSEIDDLCERIRNYFGFDS